MFGQKFPWLQVQIHNRLYKRSSFQENNISIEGARRRKKKKHLFWERINDILHCHIFRQWLSDLPKPITFCYLLSTIRTVFWRWCNWNGHSLYKSSPSRGNWTSFVLNSLHKKTLPLQLTKACQLRKGIIRCKSQGVTNITRRDNPHGGCLIPFQYRIIWHTVNPSFQKLCKLQQRLCIHIKFQFKHYNLARKAYSCM